MNRTVGGNLAISAVVASAVALSGLALSGWSPRNAEATSTVATPAPSVAARSSSAPAPTATTAPPAAARPVPHLPAARPATLTVIGDSTSNQLGGWVNVLGEQLGESRVTRVQRISQTGQSSYRAPIRYGDEGPELQVWNASTATPFAAVTDERARVVVPKRPDVVLLSVGRAADARVIGQQLSTTRSSILKAYPQAQVVVVKQPAATPAQRPAIAAVGAWAVQQGVPAIDVAAAFASSPGVASLQNADGITDAGAQLWAATVHQALTGQRAAADESPEDTRDSAREATASAPSARRG